MIQLLSPVFCFLGFTGYVHRISATDTNTTPSSLVFSIYVFIFCTTKELCSCSFERHDPLPTFTGSSGMCGVEMNACFAQRRWSSFSESAVCWGDAATKTCTSCTLSTSSGSFALLNKRFLKHTDRRGDDIFTRIKQISWGLSTWWDLIHVWRLKVTWGTHFSTWKA